MAAGEDKQENFVFSKTENESGEMRTKEKKGQISYEGVQLHEYPNQHDAAC